MPRYRNETIEIDAAGNTWVRSEDTDHHEPILIRQWWQLNTTPGQRMLSDELNGAEAESRGDGYYSVYHQRLGSTTVRLPHGGQTFSTRRQRTQLLPPKGYPKAAWRHGRWVHQTDTTRDLGRGREGKVISDITMTHEEAVREDQHKRELQEAQMMAEDWKYKGNKALERGDRVKAEKHFAKAQPWLDKMNRLLGNGDGSEA